MASLKEVKQRIATVQSTKKITVARQMISSARLHQAQGVLEHAQIYGKGLEELLCRLQEVLAERSIPLLTERSEGPVAVVVMASNSGMCGAFNANMIREVAHIGKRYPQEELLFYPIGKKIRQALLLSGQKVEGSFDNLMEKPSSEEIAQAVDQLMEAFLSGGVKRVDLLYYHFRNLARQEIQYRTLLPLTPVSATADERPNDDYIFEPSLSEVLETLLPEIVRARFRTALADNHASEFGARTMAMQLASENADQLLEELQRNYNKLRQQNITSELLDIIGSSFA